MAFTSWLIGIVVLYVLSGFKIVKEYERGIVFRLGKYVGTRNPGLNIILPIFENLTKVSLRTVTMDIPSQKIISKDNVSIDIAAVTYAKIVDSSKSVLAIENVYFAVNQISQTTIRNVMGQF